MMTRAWWISYGMYLAFVLGCYWPARWLLYSHSHAVFWVSWSVILFTGLTLMNHIQKIIERRRDDAVKR